MQHLLANWHELEPLVRKHPVMLFLDYDGTLTPIVPHPRSAYLSPEGKRLLRDLAFTEGMKTAIVSGRSLADLKDRVAVPGLLYAGNHGLEFEGPSVHFVHPEAFRTKDLIREAATRLKEAFKSFPGVLVENKVFTVSVHYRRLAPEKMDRVKTIFSEVLKPYLSSSKIVLKEGKKVWEIRPKMRWNRGTLVLWLFARVLAQSSERVLPIYVGDDQTDEDAFLALKRKGISVKVLEDEWGPSEAVYFVHSTKEVFDLLGRLLAIKRTIKGV